jgi:hypothetical protein
MMPAGESAVFCQMAIDAASPKAQTDSAEKGKPIERWGRKATGLKTSSSMTAGSPVRVRISVPEPTPVLSAASLIVFVNLALPIN